MGIDKLKKFKDKIPHYLKLYYEELVKNYNDKNYLSSILLAWSLLEGLVRFYVVVQTHREDSEGEGVKLEGIHNYEQLSNELNEQLKVPFIGKDRQGVFFMFKEMVSLPESILAKVERNYSVYRNSLFHGFIQRTIKDTIGNNQIPVTKLSLDKNNISMEHQVISQNHDMLAIFNLDALEKVANTSVNQLHDIMEKALA